MLLTIFSQSGFIPSSVGGAVSDDDLRTVRKEGANFAAYLHKAQALAGAITRPIAEGLVGESGRLNVHAILHCLDCRLL